MNELLQQRWADVCRRWDAKGYAALSQPERTWLNVRSLIDSIENGGLISYFYNSAADTFDDCLKALDQLGAQQVKEQIERIRGLFPGGVPDTLEARNVIINSWPKEGDVNTIDQLLDEVDERLMPMMASLEENLSAFVRRSGLVT